MSDDVNSNEVIKTNIEAGNKILSLIKAALDISKDAKIGNLSNDLTDMIDDLTEGVTEAKEYLEK